MFSVSLSARALVTNARHALQVTPRTCFVELLCPGAPPNLLIAGVESQWRRAPGRYRPGTPHELPSRQPLPDPIVDRRVVQQAVVADTARDPPPCLGNLERVPGIGVTADGAVDGDEPIPDEPGEP